MLCICLVGGGAVLAGFENGNPPQIGMPWAGGGWGGGVAPSTSHACMVGRIPYSCNLSIHTFAIYVAMTHINVYVYSVKIVIVLIVDCG